MRPAAVAVTGANGFVGGVIANALGKAGFRVVELGRRPSGAFEFRTYSLAQAPSAELLDGVDAVIHCAYDLSLTDEREVFEVNVNGTRRLVESAAARDVRFLAISSLSAYAGTRQVYGRAKLEIERIAISKGGEALRPGLVWGAAQGGMLGTLKRLAALPLIPVFGSGLYQYLVHADDVGAACTTLLDLPRFGQPLGLANPERVDFRALLESLAERGRPARFVNVPWQPVYAAMRAVESTGMRGPVRADSLLGLVKPAQLVRNVDYWGRHGVQLRRYPAVAQQGPS